MWGNADPMPGPDPPPVSVKQCWSAGIVQSTSLIAAEQDRIIRAHHQLFERKEHPRSFPDLDQCPEPLQHLLFEHNGPGRGEDIAIT